MLCRSKKYWSQAREEQESAMKALQKEYIDKARHCLVFLALEYADLPAC